MSTTAVLSLPDETRRLKSTSRAYRTAGTMLLAGLLVSAVFSLWHHERFFAAYLTVFAFLLSISLGGLFFVIAQHLVRAGWSVTVRRVAEAVAYNFKILPILFLPLIGPIAQGSLMPQASLAGGGHHAAAAGEHGAPADEHTAPAEEHAAPAEEHGAAAHHGPNHPAPVIEGAAHVSLDPAKAWYLGFWPVIARLIGVFVIWFLMAHFYYSNSVKQDETGDPALTNRMQRWAPIATVVFAITTSIGAFDLIMALDPYWYSTIFGVYYFAGGLAGFFAFLAIALYLLQRSGHLTASVTPEHYHDVGKFMFAFVVFWAYIAYSQFMLIWYGNIPEETVWYLIRQTGDWKWVSLFLVFGHFVVPFLLMLSRFPKRRPGLLALGAAYVLFVHFVDMYWLIAPQTWHLGVLPVPLLDLGLLLALGGIYLWSTVSNLRDVNLIPIGDPRLVEALNHENY